MTDIQTYERDVGDPFVPLTLANSQSSSGQSVPIFSGVTLEMSNFERLPIDESFDPLASHKRGETRWAWKAPLEPDFDSSPYHAGLAGLPRYTSSFGSCFSDMLLSRWPFGRG